ncbi:MAG TPA: response regulator [Albitalea sp.]|nr:response regulator [Albitalea sp.]
MLIIDTSEATADLLALDLLQGGVRFVTEQADSLAAVEEALRWFEPDLVLSEFALPELDGMQTLGLVRRLCPAVPFVSTRRSECR